MVGAAAAPVVAKGSQGRRGGSTRTRWGGLLLAVALAVATVLGQGAVPLAAGGPVRTAHAAGGGEPPAETGVAAGGAGGPADPAEVVEEQWDSVRSPELDGLMRQIEEEMGVPGGLEVPSLVSRMREGGFVVDFPALGRYLVRVVWGEVPATATLLGKLVLLALAAGVLVQLGEACGGGQVARAAHLVVFLGFMALSVSAFVGAFAAARAVVNRLVSLMLALIPPFLALTAASGTPASAGLLHPALMLVVNVAGLLGATVAVPMLFGSALIELVDGLGERRRLEGVSTLLRQVSVWTVGLGLAAFLGVAVVQNAAGRALDGVLVRTAKFLSGTFVPVVGKMFSDATEVVFASTRLVKTGLGVGGAVAVLAVAALPLVKIVVLVLCFRLAAALLGALDAGQLAACLRGIAGALGWLGVIVAMVALSFLVCIAILVGAARPA